ncbi:hypothetical protein LG943_11335 [Streptomonospora sp. S1-112]|uniref:Uncharacterized protein n=1 Tax=Streptomonospora mangrovi TaxID=2883123 RepID=A0A9X3SN73_9ACTN|nr:hypothetical protein [Streptomonospora mangrovi]MDA0564911.1 hypothetical protein [Streptomonospora mangrovi]
MREFCAVRVLLFDGPAWCGHGVSAEFLRRTRVHVVYDQAVLWAVVHGAVIASLVVAVILITVGRRPEG